MEACMSQLMDYQLSVAKGPIHPPPSKKKKNLQANAAVIIFFNFWHNTMFIFRILLKFLYLSDIELMLFLGHGTP